MEEENASLELEEVAYGSLPGDPLRPRAASFAPQWRLTPAQEAEAHREELERKTPTRTSTTSGRGPNASSATSRGTPHSFTAQGSLAYYQPDWPLDQTSQGCQNVDLAAAQEQQKSDLDTLQQVHRSEREGMDRSMLRKALRRVTSLCVGQCEKPDNSRLVEIASRTFPPRMKLPILVCDVFAENARIHHDFVVGDIEKVWKEKPDEAVIRWIHAPVGVGLLHSSLEDMFRHWGPPGMHFEKAGSPGFPYVEIDSLNFRHRGELQHMRDVHRLLKLNDHLNEDLIKLCLPGDNNDQLKQDLLWRARHIGTSLNFWNFAKSDFPMELSERSVFGDDGPLQVAELGQGPLDSSVLGNKLKQFEHAQLVLAPFRFFHRGDGYLLTMSSATGVDTLHRDFYTHVSDTLHKRMTNADASVVYSQMMALRSRGAQDWHELSVEWFLIYLVTELGVAPQNMTSGRSAPSLFSAMQSSIRELKRRRYDPWQETETNNLVKEYLVCIDQLKALSVTFQRRLSFFIELNKDLHEHEARNMVVHNREGPPAIERINWALGVCKTNKDTADFLLEDTTRALDTLFQLQTMQQNELAITANSQSKAVLIITSVTVVFLPLSFFCSYYGMNFTDIRNTARTQTYFWKLCGSITFAIVTIVVLLAFRHQILLGVLEKSMEGFRQRRHRQKMRQGARGKASV